MRRSPEQDVTFNPVAVASDRPAARAEPMAPPVPTERVAMAPGGQAGGGGRSPGAAPAGLRDWIRRAFRFAADRSDFRRNLIVNLGLFAAGVWVARNLTDIDLVVPQPVA